MNGYQENLFTISFGLNRLRHFADDLAYPMLPFERPVRGRRLRKEQQARLKEELRQKRLAAERAERERIQKLEKARIDRLLGQAAAFEQAAVIRRYVEAVQNAISGSSNAPTEDFDSWSRWALAEADRIDPSRGERYLESMIDTN